MNERQKTYDSYSYTIKMLKISESLYHQQNLFLIKTRKSAYMPTMGNSNSSVFKRQEDPVNEYFRTKNDQFLQSKILSISKKPAKPVLNTDFITNEKKKKQFVLKMKETTRRAIQKENEEMAKRIDNLQSFISTKEMDNEYNGKHQKLVKKLKKVPNGKLLLPTITVRNVVDLTHQKRNLTEMSNDKNKPKPVSQTID